MKKYLLLFTLFGPLYGALPGPKALEKPKGLTLHEALEKHSSHRTMQQIKKGGGTALVTGAAYGLSRTDFFQQMFPQLFHRDGTSYVILGVIGVIAGGGGIWVLMDKFEEWGLRQKATEDMLKSSEILEKLLPVIKEVQENQADLQNNIDKWGPKIAEALDNSVRAREGYEAVLESVEKIVGDMGDDKTALGQITSLRDQIDEIQAILMKTRQELGDTTALTNEMALAHIKDEMDKAPNINLLEDKANELEAASKEFKKVPQKKHRRWKII